MWSGETATPPDLHQYRWVHIRHPPSSERSEQGDGGRFSRLSSKFSGVSSISDCVMEKRQASAIQYQYQTEPMSMSHTKKDAETYQREGCTLLDETHCLRLCYSRRRATERK
jgi:hypothetical protein